MVYSKKETMNENKIKREKIDYNFKPKISRGPNKTINNEIPLHDRLISEGNRLMKERNKRKQQRYNERKQARIETKSVDLLENKKKYILANVFEVLDGDNDGMLSKEHCMYDKLNQELRNVFLPLIEEMRDTDVRLSKEDFIECSLQLYKKLTPTQRNALLEAGRVHDRTPREEKYSFSPFVSQKSKEMAELVRPQAETVEERLLSGKYAKEEIEYVEEEY